MQAFLTNNGKLAKEVNENHLRYLPLLAHITYTSDPEKLPEIAERIKVYYFGAQDIGLQTDTQLVNMFTDVLFTHPMMKSILSHRNKTYVYLYDHNNQAKKYKNIYGTYEKDLGVYHGQELLELFSSTDESQGKLSPDDLRISKQLIDYWTNFATYGNPNGKEFESKEIWTPTKSKEIDYLWIKSGGSTMAKGLLQDRYNFWDSLPLGLNWLALPEVKDSQKKSGKRQPPELYQSKEFF